MEDKAKKNKNGSGSYAREDSWFHTETLVRIAMRVVVSLSLLIGGLVLLAMRIAGWSIIFGLPMIIFGSVFIIYTYDEVLSRGIQNHNFPRDGSDED